MVLALLNLSLTVCVLGTLEGWAVGVVATAAAGTTAGAARWRIDSAAQLGNGHDGRLVREATPVGDSVLVCSGICGLFHEGRTKFVQNGHAGGSGVHKSVGEKIQF